MKIAELPFRERPILELLDLAEYRESPNHDYAGYGWARVPRIWIVDADSKRTAVDDVLVLALHTADDSPAIADDLQLEFDLPTGPVAVMASTFLATWLPRLPRASAIVLCVCNPHDATLAITHDLPIHVPAGDVHSWLDHDNNDILLTATAWSAP